MRISFVVTKFDTDNVVQKIFTEFQKRINKEMEKLEKAGFKCHKPEIIISGALALAVINYEQK